MNAFSDELLAIGKSVLNEFKSLPGAKCGMITGSVAEGHADEYSDLDMTVYYSELPPESAIASARDAAGGGPVFWRIGEPGQGDFAEAFRVRGVECQIGHATIARWEADIERVLSGKQELGSPLHEAMSGTLISVAVFGDALLDGWKDRLRQYPQSLAQAMVKHHLSFFPTWALLDRLRTRDAGLWMRQVMVESSFNILGVLAGLNRTFFTPFQFKRTSAFIATLPIAPPALGERLGSLWSRDLFAAARELRDLVRDTVMLVEKHMPEVDTTQVRKALARTDIAWKPRA